MPAPTASVFPGPRALGRGVVVGPGAPAPDGYFPDAPRVRIDDAVLAHPEPAAAFLHHRWATRAPVVIELAVPNDALREPEVDKRAPWELPHGFTFARERLHFLVWANTYDARGGAPVWWHGELARRRGATPSKVADAAIGDPPERVWCDGGPRGPVRTEAGAVTTRIDGHRLIHRESIQRHKLTPLGEATPTADLAPDQLAAVAHHGGAARIVAPAGSGKTRVLTARLRHLVADRHVEPELVTAVAYNNRAAQEMRDRLVGVRADVRTLHSLGLWICNLEQRRELVTERDQRAILDRLVRTAKIPNQDPFQPYLDALTESRLALRDPAAVGLAYELDDFEETFRRYRDELDRRGAMDFDEQIFHAIELLLTRPDLRRRAQDRCTHLLVDEFQDLTPAFHLLVRLVASPSLEVFGVGDDDQVIYGYAGADPAYLIDFARDFPGAGDHPLEVNYRCPPAVVDQAVTLLSHNARRVRKEIRPGRAAPAASAGVAVHAVDAGAMASRTVSVIGDLLDGGAVPSDVAVLARVNASLLPVQVALGEAGIPRTAPLDATVLGRTGVRTALAYLRLGLDPERMRREDVFDTLNRPSRKVKSAVSELLRGPRWSWDQLAQLTDSLSTTHAERWQDYLDDLMGLANAITDGADTAAVLWHIRHRIGLGEAMDTLDASRSRPEGSSHGDDLDALAQLAALRPDPATFRDWLVESLRLPGQDDGVMLSTVHRVKGMEWDHVVVFAANGGLLPHRLAEEDEEERRVFHVAVTRCRESVAVVGDRANLSPFVDELRHPPADRTTRPADAGTDRPTPRPVGDGLVAAEAGLALVAPGGVPATIEQVAADPGPAGRKVVVLDVAGGRARLSLDAPVEVDGQTVRLQARAARVAPPEVPGGRMGRLAAPTDHPLDDDAQARFESLREWRRRRAGDDGVPPYIIFHDSHLTAIAREAPSSLVGLSRIAGVGPTKLERYGDEILEVLEAV